MGSTNGGVMWANLSYIALGLSTLQCNFCSTVRAVTLSPSEEGNIHAPVNHFDKIEIFGDENHLVCVLV